MKIRLIIILAIFSLLHVAHSEDGQTMTISTNLVKIAPSRLQSQTKATAWATNTVYAQGTLVLAGADFAEDVLGNVTDGQVYMAAVGGTSSNSPSIPVHTNGEVVEGTVTWRHITTGQNLKPVPRLAASIISLSTNQVTFGTSPNLVAGAGDILTGVGTSWSPPSQAALYSRAGTTGNGITITEYLQ